MQKSVSENDDKSHKRSPWLPQFDRLLLAGIKHGPAVKRDATAVFALDDTAIGAEPLGSRFQAVQAARCGLRHLKDLPFDGCVSD